MKILKRLAGILWLLVFSGIQPTFSQTIIQVPPTSGNDRFLDEIYSQMKRPGLSIIGFDNGGDNSRGYGLKQVLNQVYVTNSNKQKEIFKEIIRIANLGIDATPNSANEIEVNSNRLQYMAFEALASYVLEHNGINSAISNNTYGIPIRSHAVALASFKNAVLTLLGGPYDTQKLFTAGSDYVKHVDTYTNMARAIDLYLALENAYKVWDYNEWQDSYSTNLINAVDKLRLIGTLTNELYDFKQNKVKKSYGLGIDADEVEPGNRPLKGYMASGYAALAMQDYAQAQQIEGYVDDAIYRASDPTGSNSTKYWMYQTSNGQNYWAEGPYYFNFALLDVVPFWHAVRANNMLGSVSDPFRSSWFLNPVNWLADTSTPDGLTPPLDDGNKHHISISPLLQWSAAYGDQQTGQKFNYIYEQLKQRGEADPGNTTYQFRNTLYLLELSIPSAIASQPITYDVNDGNGQQLIVRNTDAQNNMSYLLLNGEKGNATIRGEGHEQPDQLQLLYYVDDSSYLMDSGYDAPQGTGLGWERSTYNNYYDHNVTYGYPPFLDVKDGYESSGELHAMDWAGGGIAPPKKEVSGARIHSDDEPSTEGVNFQKIGNIDILKGKISLSTFDNQGRTYEFADYRRRALLINDAANSYLIDINMVNTDGGVVGNGNWLIQSYNINSSLLKYDPNNDGFALFENIDQKSNKHLFVYPSRVERNPLQEDAVFVFNDTAQEKFRDTTNTKRLDIWDGYGFDPRLSRYFTAVSFIKPLSMPNQELDNFSSHFANLPTTFFNETLDNLENRHYQAWYWKSDDNTVDVFAAQSSRIYENSSNRENIDFNVNADNIFIPGLHLPAGKDYGFARFRKQNGVWEPDADYQVNLQQNASIYTANTTLGNTTYANGSDIFVADNITLTYSGNVAFNPNSTVYLGKNAAIHITGQILAEGTTFQSMDPNDPAQNFDAIELHGGIDTFRNSIFKGGDTNVYVGANTQHATFDQCEFIRGGYGVYVNGGEAELLGVNIHDNTQAGLYLYNAEVHVKRQLEGEGDGESGFFYPSKIEQNTNRAVYIGGTSQFYMENTRISNISGGPMFFKSGSIYVGPNARFYPGNIATGNTFQYSSEPYIYNDASPWTVDASYNYWNGGTTPNQGQFSGNVIYTPVLTEDPAQMHYIPPPPPDDCLPDVIICPKSIMATYSAEEVSSDTAAVKSAAGSSNVEHKARQMLAKVYNHIQSEPGDAKNPSYLKTVFWVLENYDPKDHWEVWHKLDNMIQDILQVQSPAWGKPNDYSHYSKSERNLRAAAIWIRLNHLLGKGNYNEAEKIFDLYQAYLKNTPDHYGRAILSLKATLYEKQKKFAKALAALEALESLEAGSARSGKSSGSGLDPVKAQLQDSMQVYGLFATDIEPPELIEENPPAKFDILPPYPNPFKGSMTMPVKLPESGHLHMAIYDMLGRKIMTVMDKTYPAGRHDIPVNCSGLSSGVYMIQTKFKNQSVNQRVTLIK